MKSVVVFCTSSISTNCKVNLEAYYLRKTLAQNTIRIFYGVVKTSVMGIVAQIAINAKALEYHSY